MGEMAKSIRPGPLGRLPGLIAACAALSLLAPPARARGGEGEALREATADVAAEVYTHYCVALSLIRAGNAHEALEELREVVRLDAAAQRAWFHLGSLHRKRGELEQAEQAYARAAELDPADFGSLFELGRVRLLLGKSDAGIEALKTALTVAEEPMKVARLLVGLQEKYGKWLDAIETYRCMLDLLPEAAGHHVKIAACYEKLQRWKEAVAAYDSYFAIDPPRFRNYIILVRAAKTARKAGLHDKVRAYMQESDAVLNKALGEGAYSELASLLVRTGQGRKAIDMLKSGLEGADDDAVEIRKVLADLHLEEGSPREAQEQIRAALNLRPHDIKLRLKLAALHLDMLRFEEAADAFEEAAARAPDASQRTRCLVGLAEAYKRLKEYDKAQARLDLILKENPKAAAIWARLGEVRMKAGRPAQAADALGKAIELAASNPQLLVRWRSRLAQAYAALGRPEEEKQQYQEINALAADPRWAVLIARFLYEEGHYQGAIDLVTANIERMDSETLRPARSLLGLLYDRIGQAGSAEEQLQRMIDENPDDAGGYQQMANFLAKHKRYDKALELLQRAQRPDADDHYDMIILLTQANVLDEAGRTAEAEEKYKQALERYPDSPGVNNNFSYFYAQHGRELEAALEMVKKALLAEPDSAAFLDTLGWVLYKMGEYEGALLKIHQAYQIRKDAVIVQHLGDALLKLGRKAQALEEYKRALELDPESKEIRKRIEETERMIQPSQAQ